MIFPLGALAALLLVTAWAEWRSSVLLDLEPSGTSAGRSSRAYEPVKLADSVKVMAEWREPAPQPRGAEWVYEIFTPPTIYAHAASGEFFVHAHESTTAPVVADFGLELIEIGRKPFRLQLVGYMGGDDDFLGVFENALTTEHFLARGGRRLPALGVTIVDLKVQRVGFNPLDSMPVNGLVAVAVVRDEETGEEITLSNRACVYAGALVATVAPSDSPDERISLRRGEGFSHGEAKFKLQDIRLVPPSIDVARELPASLILETKTLTLRP